MNELTAGDIWRIREQLERDAASALGKAMFAFSGLDTNLGLMVASVLRYVGKEGQAARVDSLNFKARLEFVDAYIASTSEFHPTAVSEVRDWVLQAQEARQLRNQLVHGRWGVDPLTGKVHNIVGLPSSDAQQTIEYTLEELDAISQEFRRLNSALSKSRQRWGLP